MKKAMTLTLSLLVSVTSLAQTTPQNPISKSIGIVPTLEQVLEKYVQAIGGKTALEKINSCASKGTFTSTSLKTKGPVELYAKAPNKQLMVLLAKGFGNYRRGFNGAVAWERYQESSEANNLSGFSKRDAEFYLPVKFREVYPKVVFTGLEKLNGREAYLLEAPAAGEPKRWYFDEQSGLLLRSEVMNSKGKVLESVDYDDYRPIDGIQEPFSIRQVDRDSTDFNIKLSEVRHNVPIDDANFDKPAKQSSNDVAAIKTQKKAPQIRFTAGNSATIPFELDDDDNEILKVRVNNSPPLNFTIDTGSDVFAIVTSEQVKNLNLTPGDKYKVGGIVGDIETASIPNVNLSLPGLDALNQTLEVFFTDASNYDESRIDGVFGFEFLKKLVVEVDYEAKTIKLFSPAVYKYAGAGEIIPVKVRDGSPTARLKMITTSGKTIESYFEIDNGLGGTLVFLTPAVKKYGLLEDMQTIQAPTSIETGGEYNRRVGRVKSVQLGRFVISNLPISLSQNAEGHGIEGILGAEVLRRFKVIYDFSHRRMILEPNSHFNESYEEDMSGVALVPENDKGQKAFGVRQVITNTSASDAGLVAGDLIIAIDNKPAAELTSGRIAQMFKQEGREYLLSIKREGKVSQIKIKLRRLI